MACFTTSFGRPVFIILKYFWYSSMSFRGIAEVLIITAGTGGTGGLRRVVVEEGEKSFEGTAEADEEADARWASIVFMASAGLVGGASGALGAAEEEAEAVEEAEARRANIAFMASAGLVGGASGASGAAEEEAEAVEEAEARRANIAFISSAGVAGGRSGGSGAADLEALGGAEEEVKAEAVREAELVDEAEARRANIAFMASAGLVGVGSLSSAVGAASV